MDERRNLLIEIIMKEKDAREQALKMLDQSLLTLGFAYIAAFALCVPALITNAPDISVIVDRAPLIGAVLCTILYFGAFYALMIIRERNTNLGHIAFLTDKINGLLGSAYGKQSQILFQQSHEISSFYYGAGKGRIWFAMYILFISIIVIGCLFVVWSSFSSGLPYGYVVIFEAVTMAAMYAVVLHTGSIRQVRQRIENDYIDWLKNDEIQASNEQTVGEWCDFV